MKTRLVFTGFRKSLPILFLLSLFSFSTLQAQQAQTQNTVFAEVACFEAKTPGAVKLFKEMSKPFHEELIRQSVILDWSFYSVDFPNGSDCECDFREVRFFSDMSALDELGSDAMMMKTAKKVFPEMDIEDVMKKFRETVEFKNSKVYVMLDDMIPGTGEINMLVVNFMNVAPGKEDTYVSMEKEVFKPIHKVSHAAGGIQDWSMWQRVIPYGTAFDEEYVTVDAWKNYAAMSNMDMMANFKKAHPTKDVDATMKKMEEIRDLKRAEIWKLVARSKVAPAPAGAASAND